MKVTLLRANRGLAEAKPSTHRESTIHDIYDRHIDTIYRVCYSLMGNRQDAEDAAQSVFVRLMENEKPFADVEHEKAWLITTARNYCRDLHRKWWRKKVVDIDASAIEIAGSSSIPLGELEHSLMKLPPTFRLILYLHYYEGYKLAEIASMLKLNLNTVKTRMRNAKKRLKLEIGEDFYE